MAGYEDDALQIQITVFEEHQVTDENKMPPMSHQELLDKLRSKVMYNEIHFSPLLVCHTGFIINIVFVWILKISNTLYDSYLQNILLQMSEMDYGDTKMWVY